MAIICPNKKLPDWRKLISLVGGDENVASRMFQQHAHLPDPLTEALNKFDITKYTVDSKIEKLNLNSTPLSFDDSFDDVLGEQNHTYRDSDGNELISVSNKLNEFGEIHFNATSVGTDFSEIGTHFHKIMELYVENVMIADDKKAGELIVKQYMSDNSVPLEYYSQVQAFISGFKGGIVLTESRLADYGINVAGTVDLIHLRGDGKIDIYDFKTSHETEYIANQIKTKGGGIWNPKLHYNGYKAKRYPAQLEVYSRMIEKVLGQPVNNKFVVPIEISYNDPSVPTGGIKSVRTLKAENVNSYNTNDLAQETANTIFKEKIPGANYSIERKNDIHDLLQTLTGKEVSRKGKTAEQYAKDFLSNKNKISADGKAFLFEGRYERFNGVAPTEADKVKQITEKFKKIDANRKNIVGSLVNYMRTGNNDYIDSKTRGAAVAKSVIKPYFDLYGGAEFETSGLSIKSLSTIDGFEDMDSWVLFEKDGVTDIVYFGSDDLNAELVTRKGAGRKTLFGKFMTELDAKQQLGGNLKNDWGDARRLEATLIAMKLGKQLRKINEDTGEEESLELKIGSVIVASTEFTSKPRAVDLYAMLPIIQKMSNHSDIKKIMPKSMKGLLLDEKSFKKETYDQNYLEAYKSLIAYTESPKSKEFKEQLQSYSDGQLTRTELSAILINELNKETFETTDDEATIKERELLAQSIFQLKRIPTSMRGLHNLYKDFQMPQNIPNRVLQALAQTVQNGVNSMQQEFVLNYKDQSNIDLKKFFDAQRSTFGHTEDLILGQTSKYYDVLYNKREFNVSTPTGVETRIMNDFTIPVKGSDAYNALPDYAQIEADRVNGLLEKYAKMSNMEWTLGQVPLVKSSFANNLYRLRRGESGQEQNYKDTFVSMFETIEDNFGFGEGTVGTESAKKIQNSFYSQSTTVGRADMLGMDESGNTIDPEKASRYETNLEVILDVFAMNAIRQKTLNEAGGMFIASETLFNMFRTKMFNNDITANLDWLEVWRTAVLHNRDVDAGTFQSRAVKTGNAIASMAMIGFKPLSPLVAYIGQQLTASSQMLANTVTSKGLVGHWEWDRAAAFMANPKNFQLFDKILHQYGVVNMDATSMLNGYRRYGESRVFSVKGGYALFHAGDVLSRGQMLVAQMIKDDTLKQHSLVNGELVYDENIGTRFSGSEGQLRLQYFKDKAKDEGFISEDGKLLRAYDNNHVSKIKADMNAIIGGFDKESRVTFSNSAKGKLFGLFKSWVPARLNRLVADRYESIVQGQLVKQRDPLTGKDIMIWDSTPMEGIFQTAVTVGYNLTKYKNINWSELTENQQNNIARASSDAIHFAMFMLLSSIAGLAVGDDKEDNDKLNIAQLILQRSLQDLMSMYDPSVAVGYISTPILLTQTTKMFNDALNVMAGSKKEGDKMFKMINLPFVGSRLEESFRLTGVEYEE